MLWSTRERGLWSTVPLVFIGVVILHALWDSSAQPWQQAIIAGVSFTLLLWRLEAAGELRRAPGEPTIGLPRRGTLTR